MSHTPVKCLFITLFILGCFKVTAQTTASSGTNTSNPTNGHENDPYSKYGIGELWNGNNTVLRGMANATSTFENPYEVNSDNPASYSFLKLTTFEGGATASTRSVVGSGTQTTTGTLSIAYLNLGIPISKNTGMCFGFRPYAHTYYNLADSTTNSPLSSISHSYNGEGNINYAYVGGATKLFKGLSIGFNVGYMFGNLRNSTSLLPIDTAVTNRAYAADFSNYDRIGGIYWKAGFLYEHKLDSELTFRFGGTFTAQQNLAERLNAYQISVYNFGDTLVNDTSAYGGEKRGKLRLPLSYSLGVMITKNDKWSLAIDYTATQWSGYNSSPDSTLNLNVGSGSYKISVGGEYTPNITDMRNYFSRVTYRMGLYYGTDYLNINNTTLPCYGITLGSSLPFRRSTSHLHAAIDIGRLGMTTNNLVQETYVRFTLGFSFNDRWFIPRKYD